MDNLPTNLLEYVRVQLSAATAPEIIRARLSNQNWRSEDIDQAFRLIQTEIKAQPPTLSNNYQTSAIEPETSRQPLLAWIFRGGFASIFLINSLTAWFKPESFINLLNSFAPIQAIGHLEVIVVLIGFNDLIIGGLILFGKDKKYVWAWAGFYLAMVSLVKLVSLF